ncbi:MAG TPA: outer membrane beta-barrel protein [Puia sp.]|nr:outer membrane beta-barrel protein [Puia sp.]
MLKATSILLLILFCLTAEISAQQPSPPGSILIVGSVRADAPLSFSTVSLLNARDSSIVLHTMTDSLGNFEVKAASGEVYLLSVSHIGYLSYTSRAFRLDTVTGNSLRFSVRLFRKEIQLAEVEVTKSPPLIERKLDRVVIRVENNIVSNGESVMELLRTLPGIVIDGADKISIKGKSGIRILVDGHDTYVKDDQLTTLLASISANNVQKIEIISNPPAQYAAEGAGGIINIITKSKETPGLSGNAYTTYSQGTYGKLSSGALVMFKDRDLILTGSYDYTHGTGFIQGDETRKFMSVSAPLIFHQVSYNPTTSSNQYFRTGIDWRLASNQHIAVSLDGAFSEKGSPFHSTLSVYPEGHSTDSSFSIDNQTKSHYSNANLNANYSVKIDSTGQSLEASYSHLQFNNNAASSYNSLYTDSFLQHPRPPQVDTSYNKASIHVNAYKLDYKVLLPGNINLETGLKFTSTVTDNNIQFYTLQNGQFLADTGRSNHFIYSEKISAAYLSARRSWKNLDMQLGLRYEYTHATLNLTTDSLLIYRHLHDWFPTLFLEYRINESNKLNFTSGRRIERPDYANLNPFAFYYDPFSYEQGNPYLLPEYTFTNELTYTYKDANSVSLGYSSTSNLINEITLQSDTAKTVVYRYENISNRRSLYLDAYMPLDITKWWNTSADINVAYANIAGNASYGTFSNKLTTVNVNFSNTFSIAGIYTVQANVLYSSPFLDGISEFKSKGRLSLGIKRSFFHKSITASLRLSDILYTDKENVRTTSLNENISLRQVRDTRRVGLTITYNFKKGPKFKERPVEFGGQEEKGRMNITPKTN